MQLAKSQTSRKTRLILIVGACLVLGAGVTATLYSLKTHDSRSAVGAKAPMVTASTPTQTEKPTSAVQSATNYCATNSADKLLLVNITSQHMWACDGTATVKESAVTTGITTNPNGVDDNTPVGTWHILAKQTNVRIRGSDANGSWDEHVDYWMPFIRNEYGFHDAAWQTFPFGDEKYHTDGSRGCVHLPIDMMAWVYNWAPVGTTVVVQA